MKNSEEKFNFWSKEHKLAGLNRFEERCGNYREFREKAVDL